MKENNEAEFIEKARTHEVQSEDPFEIYDLLNKKEIKEATQGDDPSHPPGFTPKDDAAKGKEEAACSVNQFSNNGNSLNNRYWTNNGYNMEGYKKNLEDIVASHGDSQGIRIDDSLTLSHLFYADDAIFIAPMGVLRDMESFRRRFFNGIDKNERKISMIDLSCLNGREDLFPKVRLFGLGLSLRCMASACLLSVLVLSCDRLLGIAVIKRGSFFSSPSLENLAPFIFLLLLYGSASLAKLLVGGISEIPEFSYSYEEWIT
ncbi:hypothetical protein Tco_0821550 [Tanacetum coccineum]|uniref:Reverse transcriptase domain-containing protein n=1 Tax=Tanacetum coccineum TaxID=301880 RepID=A0ABQ5ACJ9_9ASTR